MTRPREKARDGDNETRSRLAAIAGDLKVLGDEAALVLRSDIPGLGAGHSAGHGAGAARDEALRAPHAQYARTVDGCSLSMAWKMTRPKS